MFNPSIPATEIPDSHNPFPKSLNTMETSFVLHPSNSDLLRHLDIDEVIFVIEVSRMSGESYHYASNIGLDYISNNAQKLKSYVEFKTVYDSVEEWAFETFNDKIQDLACEEGPELEAAQYSAYMAEKAEPDYH